VFGAGNTRETPRQNHFQHVLVNSEDKNLFMILVLDIANRKVLGHRLLELNLEYGLHRN
jgi:hypothetical protein